MQNVSLSHEFFGPSSQVSAVRHEDGFRQCALLCLR